MATSIAAVSDKTSVALGILPHMIDDAACWTVVQPVTGTLTVAAIARGLGGSLDAVDNEPGEREEEDYYPPPTCSISQGVRPEVLRTLSDGARTVSLFWNINAHARLMYAAYGSVITGLDPLFPDERWGSNPHALDDELAALGQAGAGWREAAMTVVEAITGVVLGHPRLGATTIELAQTIPDDPRPPSTLGERDPDLDVRLRLASEEVRLAVLHRVMTDCLTATGLADEPVIGLTLDRLAAGQSGLDLEPLLVRLAGERSAADDPMVLRAAAVRALRAAVSGRGGFFPYRERLDALVIARESWARLGRRCEHSSSPWSPGRAADL